MSGVDGLIKFFWVITARKKFIATFVVLPTSIAIAVVLLSQSVYKSEALVNPPQKGQGSPLSALDGLAGGMGGLVGSLFEGESGLDDCLNILGSSQFAGLVVKRFDLETAYQFKRPGKKPKKYYHADVLKEFRMRAAFEKTEENAIKISMRDTSAARAQEIVSYMILLLDSLYTDIQRKSVQQKLMYVDQRLLIAETEAKALEDSLIAFQKGNNIIIPEAQARLVLQNAAQTEIRKRILEEEIALEASLRGTTSTKHRDLLVQKRLLEETLRDQMEGGRHANTLMPSTVAFPALAAEYYRIERAYLVRLAVYKFLVQQVELLKIDAEKNIQVISVVDPPWVNDKRVSPKRRIIVQAVFIVSLILAVVSALLWEAWKKHRKENPDAEKLLGDIRANLLKL